MRGNEMNIDKDKNAVVLIVSACIIALSVVVGIAFYNISDRSLMSKNISEAVAKGMDPLSVRCSYANSSDTICIAYAASTNRK